MRRFCSAMAVARIASALSLVACTGWVDARLAPNLPETARRVVEGTNALRKGAGVGPLRPDPKLQAAAMTYARLMVFEEELGHDVDWRKPRERVRAAGYDDCLVAENVAYRWSKRGFTTEGLAWELLEGWRKSPQDLRDMLHPDAVDTAVAIAHSDDSRHYYAVQLFARPRAMRIRFEVRNQSGESLAYRVGERDFTLPGKSTRVHEVCTPERVSYRFGGATTQEVARDGAAFTVR